MRKRVLTNVKVMLENYRFFFTCIWLVGLPIQVIVPMIVLPRGGAKFWLALVTGLVVWTICFLVELVFFRLLKTLFYERLLRALTNEQVSSA